MAKFRLGCQFLQEINLGHGYTIKREIGEDEKKDMTENACLCLKGSNILYEPAFYKHNILVVGMSTLKDANV